MYDEIGAIINRIPDESVIKLIDTNGIEVLSYIPVDSNLAVYDIEGKNITKLPDDSNIVKGTAEALEKSAFYNCYELFDELIAKCEDAFHSIIKIHIILAPQSSGRIPA